MNKYKSYKKVDIPWLSEIPSHWEVNKLKENIITINGYAFKNHDFSRTGDRVIRISDFNEFGFVNKSIVRVLNSGKYNRFKVLKYDILLCLTGGTVGKNYFVENIDVNLFINQRVAIIRAKNIYEKLLSYMIRSWIVQNTIENKKTSLNDNISTHDIENIKFPIPPLPEQKQIANYLDWKVSEIDKLIYLEKEKIKQTESLKKSIIAKAVTQGLVKTKMKSVDIDWIKEIPSHWDMLRLNQVSDSINSSLTMKDVLNEGQTRLYDAQKQVGFVNLPSVGRDYISIIKDGAGVGRVRILPEDSLFLGTMSGILAKENIIRLNYLQHLLGVFDFSKYISGTTIPHIYYSKYSRDWFPIPPLPEQKQIAKYLDKKIQKIDEINTLSKEKIQKLISLKQSLISEVVTGQIDVQNIKIPKYEKVANIDDAEAFNELESSEDDN